MPPLFRVRRFVDYLRFIRYYRSARCPPNQWLPKGKLHNKISSPVVNTLCLISGYFVFGVPSTNCWWGSVLHTRMAQWMVQTSFSLNSVAYYTAFKFWWKWNRYLCRTFRLLGTFVTGGQRTSHCTYVHHGMHACVIAPCFNLCRANFFAMLSI